MKRILFSVILMMISAARADTTGCYVLVSNPDHCFEQFDSNTEILRDLSAVAEGASRNLIYAKYGLLLGSVLLRMLDLGTDYELQIEALQGKIKRLKRTCGSKCAKIR